MLGVSSIEQDQQEATDLIVLKGINITIAARMRRPGYAKDYPNQFTIRSQRDSGATTELRKIINGFGDWMFYGHAADSCTDTIALWYLIDLSAFRAHLISSRQKLVWGKQPNLDGTHFVWFNINSFPSNPPLLIAEAPF